jgi:hypothetical protein
MGYVVVTRVMHEVHIQGCQRRCFLVEGARASVPGDHIAVDTTWRSTIQRQPRMYATFPTPLAQMIDRPQIAVIANSTIQKLPV